MGGARGDITTITGHKANVNPAPRPASRRGVGINRKKLCYGARVDEPVCMIDVADSNAVYYYHFDGLGSVVALSDSNGDFILKHFRQTHGK